MNFHKITLSLCAWLVAMTSAAQTSPTQMVGNLAQWSGYGTASFGSAQGFTCNVTVGDANFKNTDNISYDGQTFTTRVKVMNNQTVELPQLSGVGTVTFYIMGGAAADVHPNGTERDYALYVEKQNGASWDRVGSIGSACPKAANIKKYTVSINQSTAIKLRLRNADQSIWLCGLTATAPTSGGGGAAVGGWQSRLVSMDASGLLTYNKDNDGFILPDWSQCGYHNARKPVPDVQFSADRVVTVSAVNGDNTANIQNAINQIGNLSKNADGIRGIVLLKAGLYMLDNTVYINKDGIIVRGEGNAFNQSDESRRTRIYRRNSADVALSVIVLGTTTNGTSWWESNTSNRQNITTQKVMPGDWSFEVANAGGFNVGDAIFIKYPLTQAWLNAVWKGGNTSGEWTTSTDINMGYYRYIERIEGNRIYLDAPMFYAMDRALSQPWVGKLNTSGKIVHESALENVDVYVDRAPTSSTNKPLQYCVNMSNCENCWMKEVSMRNFVHAGVHFQGTTRSTVMNCYSVDPSGLVDGGNYYNFDVSPFTQLLLIKDCYARNGRHNFVSNGCASVSGIAVVNFQSANPKTCSEGHRYWSQGILFDNWVETTGAPWDGLGLIGMYLRNNMGTVHGWGGTQSVCWNCDVKNGDILLDKVPTGQNYAIGCKGRQVHKYLSTNSKYTTGYVEGFNQSGIQPASLYEAQRRDYALRTGGEYDSPMTGVYLIGADGSVGKPAFTSGNNWNSSNAISLAKEGDGVYATTLIVGTSLNKEQVNFKLFPSLMTWQTVGFTGTAGDYHYTLDSDVFAIGTGNDGHDDGNIYLKNGQTLTDGDIYTVRLDITGGTDNAVLTIEKKPFGGIWIIGADGSVGETAYGEGTGWTEGNAFPLKKVKDGVYEKTLKVGETLNASQVNFKFFAQAGWGDEFLATDNDYRLSTENTVFGIGTGSNGHDNGNIFLLDGQTLAPGEAYTFRINITGGTNRGVLTIEKQLAGLWIIGADGSVGEPSYTDGTAWNPDHAIAMAKDGDRFTYTFTVGETLNASQVNFKFFGQAGWGDEYVGTSGGAYRLVSASPLFEIGTGSDGHGDGNIYLRAGQTLQAGDKVTVTIDCSEGFCEARLYSTVESVPTAISSAAHNEPHRDTIYDLQGRRVASPSSHGVYIVGRRKAVK